MYKTTSPSQSTTSLSDIEDDDYNNKSTFFASDPVAATPAQWSSRNQLLLHPPPTEPSQTLCTHASRLPPEILIHILKHLHSSRDIYHALLVSRAWCECSVELLWHRPNFQKLSTLGKMMRILAREDQTFLYARFIRRLNFLYLGADLTDSLFSRLAQCVRLERLTLINCSSLTDGALARVLPCCPNLVALDLTGVVETTDRAIVALASSTKRLQGINLGGCKKLTDKGVLALAANCPLLRRVKLSQVEQVTDEAISALAKSCPLLLEIDLHSCKKITEASVRDLWVYSNHMREMRLSYCVELTDAAFPASPRTDMAPQGLNPFPSSTIQPPEKQPLRLSRPFEHLRMLDLTGCSLLTDEAIEGIVSVAPKIRNLVLAKCTQLTDNAVEAICGLGKHLHYLHLGHAGSITDRSIRSLARACTRLRYIDLANCLQLTDMSVFELASLQKLRRIGLVRVNNLTDQAIYSLGERHATLERIHLSYCDQITVMAIHFLLQKLPKLTHLSLTGIPAFRRNELQQFCREPPQEFNSGQRAAFCVYSGKGVAELRTFLSELFNTITDEINPGDGTEYDEDYEEEEYPSRYADNMEVVDDGDDEEEEEEVPESQPNVVVARGGFRTSHLTPPENAAPQGNGHHFHQPVVSRELLMTRERGNLPVLRASAASPQRWVHGLPDTPTAGPSRRPRGFGHQPIVETSTSPTPSDVASVRSAGTNRSNGTAFFRNYTEAATETLRQGVMTPDLVFAEIGHGRGAVSPTSILMPQATRLGSSHAIQIGSPAYATMTTAAMVTENAQAYPAPASSSSIPSADQAVYPPSSSSEGQSSPGHDRGDVLADASNSYQRNPTRAGYSGSWTSLQGDGVTRSASSSPTTRELQESVHSVLGQQSPTSDALDVDGRGRSVKRSLRNTINVAEQYASSFFFGRGANGEGSGGPANPREADTHGH